MMLTKLVTLLIVAESFHSKLTNDKKIYKNLKKTLRLTKESCGEVCNQSLTGEPGHYFDKIRKNINCSGLFENSNFFDTKFEYPPQRIPKWLITDFNYNGKVQIFNSYRDDTTNQEKNLTLNWSKEIIGLIEESFLDKKLRGRY